MEGEALSAIAPAKADPAEPPPLPIVILEGDALVTAHATPKRCAGDPDSESGQASARYMLRAFDAVDFSLVRPIFGTRHQTGADGVLPDVIPFLLVAFLAAKQVVECAWLPEAG